jgi:hypothetical protein
VERRIMFPWSALVSLSVIVGLLLVATVAPVLVAVRRISVYPDLRLEE